MTPFNRRLPDPDIRRYRNPLTAAGRAALDDEITRQAPGIAVIDALVAIPLVLRLRRGRKASPVPLAADEARGTGGRNFGIDFRL